MRLQTRVVRRRVRLLGILILTTGLAGCDSTPEETTEAQLPVPEETSDVLAEVSGSPITAEDVSFTIDRTFSSAEKINADDRLQRKVLESLVASRAMRLLAEAQLSPQEQEEIRRKAEAYEEELFVQAYLKANAEPQPVTSAQVEAYYEENKHLFGAAPLRDFELLSAAPDLNEDATKRLLTKVADIRSAPDWASHQGEWQRQYGLTYRSVNASQAGLLDPSLEKVLSGLAQGETSDIVYLNGRPHLLRLQKVSSSPARPLSEVSSDIRKTLAPQQLREAVKEASEQARAQLDITYVER